jgi:hypothetical protein
MKRAVVIDTMAGPRSDLVTRIYEAMGQTVSRRKIARVLRAAAVHADPAPAIEPAEGCS